MGVYTPKLNLYKPADGETGWGDLVDANWDTLDNSAPLASPALSGTPTAPTAAPATNTTQIATTAFVTAAVGGVTSPVTSVFSRTGAVVAGANDYATVDNLLLGDTTNETIQLDTPGGGIVAQAQNYVQFITPGPQLILNAVSNLIDVTGSTRITAASAQSLDVRNTSQASSSAAQSSPSLILAGQYWNGTASALDEWTIQDVVGNGTNGTSQLAFTHSGTTGAAAVVIPTLQIGTTATHVQVAIVGTSELLFTGGGAVSLVCTGGLNLIGSGSAQIGLSGVPNLQVAAISGVATFNIQNITAATSSQSQSMLLNLQGQYWNGSAAANDTWGIENLIANGTNGASTLTFSHSGTAGAVKIDLSAASQVVHAGGSTSAPSISYTDGTTGFDFGSGFSYFCATGGPYILFTTNILRCHPSMMIGWSASGTAGVPQDTAFSRIGAATVALGNGTANDYTGSLQLANITQQNGTAATSSTSQSSPTLSLNGTYWNGTSSATDSWTIQNVVANGTNGFSSLTLAHSGSPNFAITIPTATFISCAAGGGPFLLTPLGGADYLRFYSGTLASNTLIGRISGQSTSNSLTLQAYQGNGKLYLSVANPTGTVTNGISLGSFNNIVTTSGTYTAINIGTAFNNVGDNAPAVNFAPTSGTGNLVVLGVTPTINQTGGANGTVTDIMVNATETAVVGTHNLMDLQVGSSSKFTVNNKGHLNNCGTDTKGVVSSASGTTVSVTYAVAYISTPVVVVTPTTNAGAFYLSASSNTGFTITYATSGAQTFNYMVMGNPT